MDLRPHRHEQVLNYQFNNAILNVLAIAVIEAVPYVWRVYLTILIQRMSGKLLNALYNWYLTDDDP